MGKASWRDGDPVGWACRGGPAERCVMTQSNTLRARNRERPTCWNRPDYPETQTVNTGMGWIAPGMLAQMTDQARNRMSKHCASWAVAEHEDPATESVPGAESWRCHGCRHLPQDQRVIERAKQAENAA